MSILVTGAKGFIGKNLCFRLTEAGFSDVLQVDKETSRDELAKLLANASFVFHLAGVNRPENEAEFAKGNADLTSFIVDELSKRVNPPPLMISSSIQATHDNAYGASKAKAESTVKNYISAKGAKGYIYRFPNVFGKWCRPNYNSFIATFCHNTVEGIDVNIHDPNAPVTLVYIDDVCDSLIDLLEGEQSAGYKSVPIQYETTVGAVSEMLQSFKISRGSLVTERVGTGLCRALYSTYLSYIKPEQFSYTIPSYGDERGVFSEMLKTKDSGQFSFFTAHPGITRGGHYHHSKNEKFLVIKGKARFKFEQISTGECHKLVTSGDTPEIVETVPGWSHDITNIGEDELIVMLWANEIFDKDAPDTIAKAL